MEGWILLQLTELTLTQIHTNTQSNKLKMNYFILKSACTHIMESLLLLEFTRGSVTFFMKVTPNQTAGALRPPAALTCVVKSAEFYSAQIYTIAS